MVTVTPIYAALCAVLYLALTARVITYRRTHRLSLGDEGDRHLLQRMRAQANAMESIPLGLILLLLADLQSAPPFALHGLGLLLTAGRTCHAYGFSADPQIMRLRVLGMVLTLTMIATTAVLVLAMTLV